MRVFFLAEKPCTFTANGLFLGTVDGFERSVELDPADGVLCELKPAGFHAVRFRFDDDFLFLPPQGVRLYYTRAGVAVYCCDFLREDAALRVLKQTRIQNTLLTLYMQGGVQLSVENETGFHILPLPDEMEHAEIEGAGNCFLLDGGTGFCILSRDGRLLVQEDGKIMERGRKVRAEVPYHDSMRHSALCTWEDGTLTECTVRTPQAPAEATFALALFESAKIGADCTPFLSPALAEKAASLREYLGKYLSVVLTERRDEVGLVYERNPRVFDVRYFRVVLDGGRISNILPLI